MKRAPLEEALRAWAAARIKADEAGKVLSAAKLAADNAAIDCERTLTMCITHCGLGPMRREKFIRLDDVDWRGPPPVIHLQWAPGVTPAEAPTITLRLVEIQRIERPQ
jgi:hypothetical protein